MISKLASMGLSVVPLVLGCGRTPAPPVTSPSKPKTQQASAARAHPSTQTPALEALFSRELPVLSAVEAVSGRGWSSEVNGQVAAPRPGTVEDSEAWDYSFESSVPVACEVFSGELRAASYVGHTLEELKKSLQLVAFAPTRLAVEGEFPIYFASVFYRRQSPEGPLAGQLKLAIGLHPTRPMVCLHDAPGYTETFERISRSLFANYHVDGLMRPTTVSIAAIQVDTMPIGFSYEWSEVKAKDRIELRSISAQIVPRAATEVMVTDDSEALLANATSLVAGQYLQVDLRGQPIRLELQQATKRQYRVSGTFDMKPFESTFDSKVGLPSPDATTQALKQRLNQGRAFRSSQYEYRPTLDPTRPIEVQYWHTKDDPKNVVHVGLGQLEMLTTLDDHGEMAQSEMKAGSQSIVIQRLYFRDDRNQPRPPTATAKPTSRQP